MALTVLDSSVIIGLLEGEDAHHARCRAVLATERPEQVVIPASAYAEVMVVPRRRGTSALRLVEALLADLGARVTPITRDHALIAAWLRARTSSLRLPDALVLATAEEMDGEAWTTDRSWGRFGRRVRVI
jgi:predicted nucleic acid-binding protein